MNYTLTNHDDGVAAEVSENPQRPGSFTIELVDNDADRTIAVEYNLPSLNSALARAADLVSGRGPATKVPI